MLSIQHFIQRLEDRAVLLGVLPQLGERLRDKHVEPVQALRLVAGHIVECLGEEGFGRYRRLRAQDRGRFGAGAAGRPAQGEARGAAADEVRRWRRLAEDEELDEGEEEDGERELA